MVIDTSALPSSEVYKTKDPVQVKTFHICKFKAFPFTLLKQDYNETRTVDNYVVYIVWKATATW